MNLDKFFNGKSELGTNKTRPVNTNTKARDDLPHSEQPTENGLTPVRHQLRQIPQNQHLAAETQPTSLHHQHL